MVQNHNISKPWTQNSGSTQLTRRHGPKHRFKFQDLTAMDQKNDHQHIRAFVKYNPRVYAHLSRWTCVYDFFYFLSAWTEICLPKKVAIKDNTCAIAPNLCHNANNLPLWSWWQHQDPRLFSPFVIKGKGMCSPWVHAEIPVLLCWPYSPWRSAKRYSLRRTKTYATIQDLPITKGLKTNIHHPTKWGSSIQPSGIYQKFTYDDQIHYTFIPGIVGKPIWVVTWPWHHRRKKEIHDIETNI